MERGLGPPPAGELGLGPTSHSYPVVWEALCAHHQGSEGPAGCKLAKPEARQWPLREDPSCRSKDSFSFMVGNKVAHCDSGPYVGCVTELLSSLIKSHGDKGLTQTPERLTHHPLFQHRPWRSPWRPLLPQMEMEVRALGQNRKACVLRGRRLTGAPAREPVVHTRSASSVRHDANQEDWRRKSPALDPLLSQNQGALDPFAFD